MPDLQWHWKDYFDEIGESFSDNRDSKKIRQLTARPSGAVFWEV